MKIWARIASGVVVEIVTLDDALVPGVDIFNPSLTFVDATSVTGLAVGWRYSGTAFTAPPAVTLTPAVPASISRRQFFQQLAVQGIITNAEALAAMAGTIPSELATLIAALPSAQQFAAQMLVSGATQFDRADTFTTAIGTAYGMTSAQIDALWIAATNL